MKVYVGDKVIAFNCKEWMKTGDVGHNEKYWQSAKVIETRKSKRGELIADVLFDNGTYSRGHFQDGLKKIKII